MINIEQIAQEKSLSVGELIKSLEELFEKIQVLLANLEEAIERSDYQEIVAKSDSISHLCAKFNLFEIAKESEHLEILATLKREGGYMNIFETLYNKAKEHYFAFKSQAYTLCR